MKGLACNTKCCQISLFPFGQCQQLTDYSKLTAENVSDLPMGD